VPALPSLLICPAFEQLAGEPGAQLLPAGCPGLREYLLSVPVLAARLLEGPSASNPDDRHDIQRAVIRADGGHRQSPDPALDCPGADHHALGHVVDDVARVS